MLNSKEFLGIFGVHRVDMGKWITGSVWFFTGGLFLLGWLFDLWTLNEQVSDKKLQYGPRYVVTA